MHNMILYSYDSSLQKTLYTTGIDVSEVFLLERDK